MRIKNTITQSVHLFTVKNDLDGMNQIKVLRSQIKESKNPLRIVIRGRGFRHGKGGYKKLNPLTPNSPYGSNQYQCSLPIKLSQKLSVYLLPKPSKTVSVKSKEICRLCKVPMDSDGHCVKCGNWNDLCYCCGHKHDGTLIGNCVECGSVLECQQ